MNSDWVERASYHPPKAADIEEGDGVDKGVDKDVETNLNEANLSGENCRLKEEMKNLTQEFQVLHRNMDAIIEQNEKVMQQNSELLSLLKASGVLGSNLP